MLNSAIIPGPNRFVKANRLGIICCTDRILICCLNGGLGMNFCFPNADIQCPYLLLNVTHPLLFPSHSDGKPTKSRRTHIYESTSQSSTQRTGTRYTHPHDNSKGWLTQKRTNQQPITPPTTIGTIDPDDEINQWVDGSEGSHEDTSTTQAGTASTAHPKATKPKKTRTRLVCSLCTYTASTMFTNENTENVV
jgi:hypothetical protein